MSNKKTLKFNDSTVKKFNNGNLDKFMGTDVVSGYEAQIPTYTVTVYNYLFDEGSGQAGQYKDYTSLKFDVFNTLSDYDVQSDSSSNGTLLGTFTDKHTIYIWGYGYKLNSMSATTETVSTTSPTSIELTGDTTIYLVSHFYPNDSCLAENTEILLADGTTKLIQDITYDDLLLTYDPYLNDFIAEYPALITGPKIHYGKHIITFDNGKYLETTDDHAVYNMITNTFQTIPEVPLDNFYGVYYDKQLGDFVPTKLVSFEHISDIEVRSYNVFTPMSGSIISNGIWTSGNFLSFEPAEKVYKYPNSRDWNKELLDANMNAEKEEDLISNYIAFNSALNQLGTNMPIQLYMCSVRKYIPMMKRVVPGFADVIYDDVLVYTTAMILKGCFANIKPYPEYCKVRLDNEIIANVKTENTFVFPNTYNEYLDLTDYKTYKAGDSKTIYINTVIVGKGAKNNG